MDKNTRKVSRIVRDLHDELGGAILIDDVMERGGEDGLSEEDVMQGIKDLEMDGLVSRIDDDTIEFM